MRFAILSDIHANRAAFQAVLDDLAGRDIGQIVLLGDLVGYGPDPEWCVSRAMELSRAGAMALRGNHDEAIASPDPAMNDNARKVIDWTRPRLSPAARAYLAALPYMQESEGVCFAHASAHNPQDWVYIRSDTRAIPSFRAVAARFIVVGHVHIPALYSQERTGVVRQHDVMHGAALPLIASRRWLAVAGAVGQPRDGVAQAGYVILDTAKSEAAFRRVPYDTAATVARMRAEGLPESLSLRLLKGA